MKKFMCLLLSLSIAWMLVLMPVGLGEGTQVETGGFDVTDILVAAIGLLATVLAAAFAWVANTYIIPWIKAHNLIAMAKVAVDAAEAALGAGHGAEKWEWASAWLLRHGIVMDTEAVSAAIDAAWEQLNLAQIAAGVKGTGDEPTNIDSEFE